MESTTSCYNAINSLTDMESTTSCYNAFNA